MRDEQRIYPNLVKVLKMFKNRPYHLAKYLMENNAFNEVFINKLINSEINTSEYTDFKSINQINEHFNALLENNPSESDKTLELNNKLDQLLKEEKYEEAIFVRDYMIKNNIPRIN